MKLFINNIEVHLEEELTPNFTLQWIDTYNPSAIKSSYSKTVKIPNTSNNARIFSMPDRDNYTFTIWNNGEILQSGYVVMNDTTEDRGKTYYNVTLYGELGNFFHNLKGDDDNPKTLADLYYGLRGYQSEKGKIIPWNVDTVLTGWERLWSGSWASGDRKFYSGSIEDMFVAVPAETNNSKFDYKKTLFAISGSGVSGSYYPSSSFNGSGSAWVDSHGKRCLILEHNDSNQEDRGDYRTDIMPIGIRYKEIIKACCNPVNNGGYTVHLDPSFFQDTNPFWNDLYLLVKQPDKGYDAGSNLVDQYLQMGSLYLYPGHRLASQYMTVYPEATTSGWKNASGNTLESTPGLSQTMMSFCFRLVLSPNQGYVQDNDDYVDLRNCSFWVEIRDADSNTVLRTISKQINGYAKLDPISGTPNLYALNWSIPDLTYEDLRYEENIVLKEYTTLGGDVTRLKVKVTLSLPNESLDIYHLWSPSQPTGQGDSLFLQYSDGNTWSSISSYLSDGGQYIYTSDYSIRDLTGDLLTPYDYLVSYCKIFNLRFYVNESEKEISILQGKNWVQENNLVDLTGKIDFSQEYKIIPRLIEEKYLELGLDYDKNPTLEEMSKSMTPFTRTLTLNNSRYNHNTKKYFDTKLKAAFTDKKTLINPEGYVQPDYPIVNQVETLKMDYMSGEPYFDGSIVSDDYTGSFAANRTYKKDLLTLQDITNDIVIYNPYSTPDESVSDPTGWDVRTISTTSQNMVVFANNKPCFLQGRGEGIWDTPDLLDCPTRSFRTSQMSVPRFLSYDANTGVELGYNSTVSAVPCRNLYDLYFKSFLEKFYKNPEQVECYVVWEKIPNLRSLYYFENQYWVLAKMENYNYDVTPTKCTFVRYDLS